MTYTGLLIHTVEIFNEEDLTSSSTTDRYGNLIVEEVTGVTEPARVQEISADEEIVNRDTTVTAYRIFLLASSVVTELSRVVWEGRSYRVKGVPWVVDGRLGPHHVEAILQEVRG
jgi:hypothetical protein